MSRQFGRLNLWVLLCIGTIARPAGAANYSVEYEMDADPSTASGYFNPSYNTGNPSCAPNDPASIGPLTPAGLIAFNTPTTGSTFANGVMHYVNNGGVGAIGYYWHPCYNTQTDYTVDMMVKVNIHTGGSRPISMNWSEGGNSGLSMQLNPNSIVFNAIAGNPLNCANGTSGPFENTDLTIFRRIRVVVSATDVQGNPDYVKHSVYNLDNGVTVYSPCTGNGGPGGAFGDYFTLNSDTCGNTGTCPGGNEGSCGSCGCPQYDDCNPVQPTDGISKGGFTIGSFSGGSTSVTDFELEYFRVLNGTAIQDATTEIHRTPLTSGCTSVSPNVAVSTSALFGAGGGSPPTQVLHSKGTPSGAGNLYWYPDIAHPSYTIASGDHFVYDIYTKNGAGKPSGAVDLEGSLGNLRDSGILDQNGKSGHPGTDLSSVALNTWYHRDFDLSSKAGQTISDFEMAHENDSADGVSEYYVCNVQVINGSTLKLVGFDQNTWVPVSDTVIGNNGYSSLVGPEMVAPPSTPPAPPLTPVTTFAYIMTNYSLSATRGFTVASDQPWLTASPTSGTIPADNVNDAKNTHATSTITATVNPSGLAIGDYVGHLTFTDGGCTTAAVRTINLHIIGCSMQVQQPNTRYVGQCNSTTTFTMKNDGATTWDQFSAAQVNTSAAWLTSFSYSPVQGTPIPAGGTVTVTANLNMASNPAPGDIADIRFRASCDTGAHNIDVIPTPHAITIFTQYKVLFDGTKAPGTNDSGGIYPAVTGTHFKFEVAQGADLGGPNQNDPSDTDPTDGKYYLLNDSSTGLSSQFRLIDNNGNHLPILESVGATVVARLKTTAFSQGATNSYYNLLIDHPTIASALYWGQTESRIREELRNNIVNPTPDINDGKYHIVRLTSVKTAPGNSVNVYIDDNPTPAMSLNGLSGTSGLNGGTLNGIGFGDASNSGTEMIYYDWVAGTNAGAFAPGEEDSCIGHLSPPSICGDNSHARMDADKDGDVDSDDFGQFQQCYSGEHGTPPATSAAGYPCSCFNVNGDPDISFAEFNQFVDCTSGPAVPWVASPNCPN